MRKRLLSLLLAGSMLLVILSGCAVPEEEEVEYIVPEGAISILFIGNSFVYVGDVPGQMQTLAKMYGIDMVSLSICPPGASLEDNREDALKAIEKYSFDYVIMNDDATRPVDSPDAFNANVKELCDAVKAAGAVPVLYNPAGVNDDGIPNKEFQDRETAAYEEAAETNGAILINAGDAWVYVYQKLSVISLYLPEDFHANDAGAYFTTCVFLATLFDIEVKHISEDNLYHGYNAIALGQAAWEFVSYYQQSGESPTEPVTVSPGTNELVSN